MKRTFVLVQTSSYSGATLLAFLLGTHPQIATVGEMNGMNNVDVETYLCSCGQRIKDCKFWRSVEIGMRHRGFEFDVDHFDTRFTLGGSRLIQYLRMGSTRINALDSIRDVIFHAWPGEIRRLKELVARNEALVETILDITGKTVFVDTSKELLRFRTMCKFSTFDLRAIHLIRDVRGVVASELRRGRIGDAREGARRWAMVHQKHQKALETMPAENRILVRYEDLCQEVQGTLEKLYHFCGVDPGVKVTDFRSASHHIIGSSMRLRPLSEIRLDERWKSSLTADQLKEIELVAGKLGRQYGY